MRAEDLRGIPLFDGVTDGQLAELAAVGEEVPVERGVDLFHQGDPAEHWWVLLEGEVELLRRVGPEDVVVARLDQPGRWVGGFRGWDENAVYLPSARGVTPGRVLRVPSADLRRLSDSWSPLSGHIVAGVFNTARNAEATARQRESLVALGTLAAGLAHELNNPAAAATRAVDSLAATAGELLDALRDLARAGIAADQFTGLDALRSSLAPPAGPVDPLELADQEEELGSWLESHDVELAWDLAPALAAAGADVGWCERAEEAVGSAALEPALRWVASTVTTAALLRSTKESTRRVSELVDAVRSYSQMDRGSVQLIDVTEGLESTLVMLGHKLRGVDVVRDFDAGVPKIEAYAGELNQVWTNLIDNAVDAMDGAGTLRLRTRPDGEGVVVEVGDSGAGMPPEVAARAFEAFYTTKPVGRGTGLGLDIARRIVQDRHGGTVTITSRPGDTVLSVHLPRRIGPPR
ncbi:cyclic nucleotide-binding protein [Motilibacter rhizosphaerae]|uniref:histidine kinase n=1 Tax=Motilibacter rhizosphaerae TaxID=598652 RepID=A0A4Q7NWS1_9ACTN|nr:ATP-binding protein [Motilibacter rhizosphaerae]RZS91786.1 cyclic nucleotide-binding protein [Motilibacter rhizosphaerae]